MRARDKELEAKWGTICTPLQMLAPDGKMRKTQAANTEGILRIIQSIPSPKAEPFKTWLAKVGAESLLRIRSAWKAGPTSSVSVLPAVRLLKPGAKRTTSTRINTITGSAVSRKLPLLHLRIRYPLFDGCGMY